MIAAIRSIAFYLIFGKPVIMYLGIITLICFLTTAYLGYQQMKGNNKIPLKYHFMMARISILMALIHGFMGFAIFY
jgi:hypothetical protein